MVFKQDDFTEQAQNAIGASYDVVRRFKHAQWDVEHVVLALLENEGSVPVQMLRELGVDAGAVSAEIGAALAQTPRLAYESNQMHPTPRALTLLQAAKDEAERLHDEYISAEHLFIAALSDERGESARVMKNHGVDKERAYQALQRVRGGAG